jgi:hypothetical protein
MDGPAAPGGWYVVIAEPGSAIISYPAHTFNATYIIVLLSFRFNSKL